MDQARIAARAHERLQGCLVLGGLLLVVGIVVTLAAGSVGILVAAVGQAVLLVGLIGFGVKLGVEAAARPTSERLGTDQAGG
jgi:hypothetical protein